MKSIPLVYRWASQERSVDGHINLNMVTVYNERDDGTARVRLASDDDDSLIIEAQEWARVKRHFVKTPQGASTVKDQARQVLAKLAPYQRYLVAAALLLAIDHFILKGAMTSRITKLARSLANRLYALLDGAISKLDGGPQ